MRRAGWSSIRGDKQGFRPAAGPSGTSVPGIPVRPQPRLRRRRGGETGSEPSSVRRDTHQYVAGLAGVGKTWLACALAHKACRDGHTARYLRLPRLLQELPIAKADGRYPRFLRDCARPDLLILDDWGLINLNDDSRRDLLEILDDRHNRKSTLVTSQLPPDKWHDYIGEPTLADAILDRLVHNAYKINLKGESMRKNNPDLTIDTTNK